MDRKEDSSLTQFDREIMEQWAADRDTRIAEEGSKGKSSADELSNEDMLEVLKKAKKIQNEKMRLKRSVEEDFGKGSVRNQPCPNCKVKLKKCICGFLEKNLV